MYFDFGVGKYADITCILRNPHRYRKWRPVFGWGHLLCHEAKQIPLLRPLSCNNKTKNLGTCWFSTGRNKSPVFFLFHTFVSSILRKMIKPPKKEHESMSITIYFGMCFRIIYMYILSKIYKLQTLEKNAGKLQTSPTNPSAGFQPPRPPRLNCFKDDDEPFNRKPPTPPFQDGWGKWMEKEWMGIESGKKRVWEKNNGSDCVMFKYVFFRC